MGNLRKIIVIYKARGFTLIELLVVISIIAVLMSILMPALNKATAAAKDAIDLSNQHQFALFWRFYTEDHDGKFPSRGSGSEAWGDETLNQWPYVLYTYMDSMNEEIWYCPGATTPLASGGRHPFAAWNTDLSQPPVIYGSYAINLWISNENDSKYWCTPSVKGAAYGPMVVCGTWKDLEPWEIDEPWATREEMVIFGYEWGTNDNEMKRVCHDRHGRHVNASFLDLHAGRIGIKHCWRTRWNREWDMTALLPVWPAWMGKFPDPEW